jgi:hypothetical protein
MAEQLYRDVPKIEHHYDYMFQYKAVWEKALTTAGVHLAVILNTLYGE